MEPSTVESLKFKVATLEIRCELANEMNDELSEENKQLKITAADTASILQEHAAALAATKKHAHGRIVSNALQQESRLADSLLNVLGIVQAQLLKQPARNVATTAAMND